MTINEHYPIEVPNQVIENPALRKTANTILGWASLVLAIIVIFDAGINQIDLFDVTAPAAYIVMALNGLFGLTVTNKNYPV